MKLDEVKNPTQTPLFRSHPFYTVSLTISSHNLEGGMTTIWARFVDFVELERKRCNLLVDGHLHLEEAYFKDYLTYQLSTKPYPKFWLGYYKLLYNSAGDHPLCAHTLASSRTRLELDLCGCRVRVRFGLTDPDALTRDEKMWKKRLIS